MNDQRHPKRTDLLDEALASYGQVDPLPGLEGRILRSMEGRSKRRRRVWFLTAWVAGLSAAAVTLLLIAPWRTSLREPAVASAPWVAPIVERPASVSVKPELHTPNIVRKVEVASAPRQTTFPAPSAVSDQEQLLISLTQSRRQILIAMAQSLPHAIREEIDIAPIEAHPPAATPESDAVIEK